MRLGGGRARGGRVGRGRGEAHGASKGGHGKGRGGGGRGSGGGRLERLEEEQAVKGQGWRAERGPRQQRRERRKGSGWAKGPGRRSVCLLLPLCFSASAHFTVSSPDFSAQPIHTNAFVLYSDALFWSVHACAGGGCPHFVPGRASLTWRCLYLMGGTTGEGPGGRGGWD